MIYFSLQTLMSLFEVMRPRFGSMISGSVKSAVYGLSSLLEALPYSNSLLFPTADDDKTKQIEDLCVSLLGIRERPTRGQGPALNSLLEIRYETSLCNLCLTMVQRCKYSR